MRVIISGGGTGGHIYPALAIAKGIETRYPKTKILYVGTNQGLEADIVPKAGYSLETINVSGLKRQLSVKNCRAIWQAGWGLYQAAKLMRRFKPDLVIGTGGYVCGPVVMAAAIKKIPTLIHEQNALPGVTNRILARFVTGVAVTFKDSVQRFSGRVNINLTGLPVRPELFSVNKKEAYFSLGLNPKKPVLLVFGGSRGAQRINAAMIKVTQTLQQYTKVQLLHATGQIGYDQHIKDLESVGISSTNRDNIIIRPYLYNMPAALAVADLVICRAGATTLAEITALGLPSILVPYPYAAENHQEFNARALTGCGAAVMILDQKLTGTVLMTNISKLLLPVQSKQLSKMAAESLKLARPKALEDILHLIDNII